jgi:hypothetical protein
MKQKFKIFLSVIVLTITFQELLYAQCDKELRSAESEKTGYRIRSRNRCEGFYESDVSSGSLNIVSVTQGKFKFKLDSNEMITVSPIVNNKTVNIRAVAIPLRTYYRMDAQLDPKTNLKWPVADVLYPKKLKDNKIGVFGWIGDQREKVYVPLKVTSSMLHDDNNNRDIYVYLRASVDVINMSWRIADLSSDNFCSKAGKWIKSKRGKYNEGTKILCKITADDVKGSVCIQVKADAKDSYEDLSCDAKIFIK